MGSQPFWWRGIYPRSCRSPAAVPARGAEQGSPPSPGCCPTYRHSAPDRRRGCCRRGTSLRAGPGCRSRSSPADSLGYPALTGSLPALSLRPGLLPPPAPFRHTRQFRFIGNQLRPAHGGVEDVVAVLVAQLGQARGDFAVANLFFLLAGQSRQFEITQGVIDRFFFCAVFSSA